MPIPNDTSSESSQRGVYNADLFGTDTSPNVDISSMCVIHTVACASDDCSVGVTMVDVIAHDKEGMGIRSEWPREMHDSMRILEPLNASDR